MAEKEPTARKPRRSKETRGGRFTPEPELSPAAIEQLLQALRSTLEANTTAELMAELVARRERILREIMHLTEVAPESSVRHWAKEAQDAAEFWRRFEHVNRLDGPAYRELAAYRLGEACMALKIYAKLVNEQRETARRGIAGKRGKAAADMAALRDAMERVPYAERGSASRCLEALKRNGWVSPWSDRVAEGRIREVLREPASKTRDFIHVPGGKV